MRIILTVMAMLFAVGCAASGLEPIKVLPYQKIEEKKEPESPPKGFWEDEEFAKQFAAGHGREHLLAVFVFLKRYTSEISC